MHNRKVLKIYYILILIFLILCSCIDQTQTIARGRIRRNTKKYIKTPNKVGLPRGYKLPAVIKKGFRRGEVIIDLYAKGFSQGNAVYFEIYKTEHFQDKELMVKRFRFGNKNILISKRSWGYRGLIGINPRAKPGKKRISIAYSIGKLKREASLYIKIFKTNFKFFRRPLDLGKYSDVDYELRPEVIAFIKKCTAKKRMVFSRISKDRLGENLSHPRNLHFITSPFWAKRLVMRYRKLKGRKIRFRNKVNIHRGLDFRGKTGTPVYSIADGRVVLAEELYYEGNFIIIDHGNRIFSYFMHLSDFNVKKGKIVQAGSMIGRVGTTGISTAAHLHVSLMIQGVQVNPLSILPLPIRD